jgi:hypothetical protein
MGLLWKSGKQPPRPSAKPARLLPKVRAACLNDIAACAFLHAQGRRSKPKGIGLAHRATTSADKAHLLVLAEAWINLAEAAAQRAKRASRRPVQGNGATEITTGKAK